MRWLPIRGLIWAVVACQAAENNLADDPSEQSNLAAIHPDKVIQAKSVCFWSFLKNIQARLSCSIYL
jgi:hypothetical protein